MIYQSLINKKRFQEHTIPYQAQELTIRLLRLMEPFLLDTRYEDEATVWEGLKESCIGYFTHALDLKAKMTLNTDRYELLMVEPGTPFDGRTMKAHGSDTRDPRIVTLCLFPALFSYPEKDFTPASGYTAQNAEVESAIVQTRNFVRAEDDWRARYKPLSKAIVLVGAVNRGA